MLSGERAEMQHGEMVLIFLCSDPDLAVAMTVVVIMLLVVVVQVIVVLILELRAQLTFNLDPV